MAIGVLSQQPGCMSPIIAGHGPARPPNAVGDLFQPASVILINGHDVLKGLFSAAGSRAPGGLIHFRPAQQFLAQVWAQDHAYPKRAAIAAALSHSAAL